MKPVWHMITGEYPPDPGGVAGYTAAVAGALADAGAGVHVWASGDEPSPIPMTPPDKIGVHRIAGRFGPGSRSRASDSR